MIQPSPYGSELTSSGLEESLSLTAATVPVTGAYRSLAALTDSITPKASPRLTLRPAFGRSRNTTSPSCACAKSVMPTVAILPSTTSHSCVLVYCRSAMPTPLNSVASRRAPVEGKLHHLRRRFTAANVDRQLLSDWK